MIKFIETEGIRIAEHRPPLIKGCTFNGRGRSWIDAWAFGALGGFAIAEIGYAFGYSIGHLLRYLWP